MAATMYSTRPRPQARRRRGNQVRSPERGWVLLPITSARPSRAPCRLARDDLCTPARRHACRSSLAGCRLASSCPLPWRGAESWPAATALREKPQIYSYYSYVSLTFPLRRSARRPLCAAASPLRYQQGRAVQNSLRSFAMERTQGASNNASKHRKTNSPLQRWRPVSTEASPRKGVPQPPPSCSSTSSATCFAGFAADASPRTLTSTTASPPSAAPSTADAGVPSSADPVLAQTPSAAAACAARARWMGVFSSINEPKQLLSSINEPKQRFRGGWIKEGEA